MSRTRYRLGSIPTHRWRKTRRRVVVALVVLAVVSAWALLITRSPWVLLFMVATGLGAFWVWNKPDSDGGRWITSILGEAVRRTLARLGRWDEYDPAHERRPWVLDRYRISEIPLAGGPLALIDTGHTLVAVLEVDGGGDGIRDDMDHNRREAALVGVVDALATPSSGVTQLDLITNVRPANPQPHATWTADHQAPHCSPDAEAASSELLDAVAGTDRYRTWIALHMDVARLSRKARELGLKVDPDVLAETAAGVTGSAARLLTDHGFPVTGGLSAARLAATIRAIMDPAWDPDDTTDTDEFWDAWPGFQPTPLGDATVTFTPDRRVRWYHATAGIHRDHYPLDTVVGRWLDPIVLEARNIPHRTVTVQLGLVSHREAREIARERATIEEAKLVRQARQGVVADGEAEEKAGHAAGMTRDITLRGHAGVVVGVHVNVAAQHAQTLRRLREAAEAAVEQRMGAELTWHDGRQPQGLLRVLPVGLPAR